MTEFLNQPWIIALSWFCFGALLGTWIDRVLTHLGDRLAAWTGRKLGNEPRVSYFMCTTCGYQKSRLTETEAMTLAHGNHPGHHADWEA